MSETGAYHAYVAIHKIYIPGENVGTLKDRS